MRLIRSLVLFTALGFAGGFLPSADAGDCDYGHGGGRVSCNSAGSCHVRDRHHPSTRYVIPRHNRGARSYGCGCSPRRVGYVERFYGPWSEMRRGIGRQSYRRRHLRHYFLRRHPFALTKGTVLEEAADVGTLLAIGDEDAGSERTLDAAGLLDRGTARFHVGEYDAARKDFVALLAKQPTEARARLGLLMVSVVKNDWSAAAGELDTLAKAGELRADDRFEIESLFADAATLKALTDGLTATASYRMTHAKAHAVTAWLLAGQGDTQGAKRFVRLAKRWGSSTPTVQALEANLGMVKPKVAPPAKPAPTRASPTESAPRVRPPNPALHREIAAVPKRGT